VGDVGDLGTLDGVGEQDHELVDVLEVVEIDTHQRKPFVRPIGMVDRAVGTAAQTFGGTEVGEGIGVRGGIGTDITFGGVAFGVGVNHLLFDSTEVGINLYYGRFEETYDESVNTYTETTEIVAFVALWNYLYGYTYRDSSFFLIGGVGLGYLGVWWEERSKTDTSLGTPLSSGGSKQEVEGGVGGTIINLGAGYAFSSGFDVRFEVPILIAFGETGGAAGVIPLFSLTAGYRFDL
jgi:hypothetical protein